MTIETEDPEEGSFEAPDAASVEDELRGADTEPAPEATPEDTEKDTAIKEIRHEVDELSETPNRSWGPEDHQRIGEIKDEIDALLRKLRQQR